MNPTIRRKDGSAAASLRDISIGETVTLMHGESFKEEFTLVQPPT